MEIKMKIKILLENQKSDENLISKHGLSLYIEHMDKKIIFDTGPDDSFIKNAEKLKVDIAAVDYLIISHGHMDHGGGLQAFLDYNKKAQIIISKHAFEKYYASLFGILKIFVGLDSKVMNERFILVDEQYNFDPCGFVFSNVNSKELTSELNDSLYVKEGNKYQNDEFKHEINLILKEDNRLILIGGCSHKGIVNIIEKSKEINACYPEIVIAGLHLNNPMMIRKKNNKEFITRLGIRLKEYQTKFYTYHCTGDYAVSVLKDILGNQIQTLRTGDSFEYSKGQII